MMSYAFYCLAVLKCFVFVALAFPKHLHLTFAGIKNFISLFIGCISAFECKSYSTTRSDFMQNIFLSLVYFGDMMSPEKLEIL